MTTAVTVGIGERRWNGRAVDLSTVAVEADAVLAAIRGETSHEQESATLWVDCPTPSAVHDYVATVPPASFDLYETLVTVARSRGVAAESAGELARARRELSELEPETVSLEAVKRRVAGTDERQIRLRERVATLRGRVAALRDVGAATDAAEAELEAAMRELTDVETERIAAEQRLDALAREARAARDRRDHRFRLEDRVANLRRRVRRELVDAVYDEFAAAVATVPGVATPGSGPSEYEGDVSTAALAAARVAVVDAPIVLVGRRFESAAAATTCLDAPVIRL